MDQEVEEFQFLGFFGICKEAFKRVLSWRHLFAKITLALIFPLAFVSLAHIHVSMFLLSKIADKEATVDDSESRHLSHIAYELAAPLGIRVTYLVCVLVFSLLPTSAVVYTVASIYTAKDLTFRRVLSVVPMVWKRLMVTFLWIFLLTASYTIGALVLMITIFVLLLRSRGTALAVVALALYVAGMVWISMVWHIASVVSVLDDASGIGAMKKGRVLVRGKLRVVAGIFLMLYLAFMGIDVGYRFLVIEVMNGTVGWGTTLVCAVLMVSLLAMLILLGLVMQTVIYFVCKSYHHESIDKSSLADHLEMYVGDYVPLVGKNVQLEQYRV